MAGGEDIADRLDDLICPSEDGGGGGVSSPFATTTTRGSGGGGAFDAETLAVVVGGWFVLGGAVLAASHFLFKSGPAAAAKPETRPGPAHVQVNEDIYAVPVKKLNGAHFPKDETTTVVRVNGFDEGVRVNGVDKGNVVPVAASEQERNSTPGCRIRESQGRSALPFRFVSFRSLFRKLSLVKSQ